MANKFRISHSAFTAQRQKAKAAKPKAAKSKVKMTRLDVMMLKSLYG